MTNETKYRGFLIVPTDPVPPIPGWKDHAVTWVHDSYDGPGDHRIGTCRDESEARAEIDEWIRESGHDDLPDGVDVDNASYIGDSEDGVYWQVFEDYNGQWYMSAIVDCNTGSFCDSLVTFDGPYISRNEANRAGSNAGYDWCMTNGIAWDDDSDLERLCDE